MNAIARHYRGSEKHKNRPSLGAKGTLCPEWTHTTPESGYGNDPFQHDWSKTAAQRLFATAVPDPDGKEQCYATENGIAFEAKPTNDGAWHGYPIPWVSVPNSIVDRWREVGVVTNRQIKQQRHTKNIHWALESIPNE